ncbi:pyridoxal-phosphate dependent enzyme [Corynebacterium sp. zg910]|nr:pyridoxal-phosphate dependent enzyme [Corynebacterium lujinxingii]
MRRNAPRRPRRPETHKLASKLSELSPGLLAAVGGTPLVSLPELGGGNARVWAKLESFNPGGSAKDRTARALVADALERGVLGPGSVVVESSSGNLGVALAREAAVGGWEFHCVVDPRTNQATLAHMRALGAHIHPVEEPDPETGNWLTARRALVGRLVDELGGLNLDQYSNRAAFRAHSEGTRREIVEQLGASAGSPAPSSASPSALPPILPGKCSPSSTPGASARTCSGAGTRT